MRAFSAYEEGRIVKLTVRNTPFNDLYSDREPVAEWSLLFLYHRKEQERRHMCLNQPMRDRMLQEEKLNAPFYSESNMSMDRAAILLRNAISRLNRSFS